MTVGSIGTLEVSPAGLGCNNFGMRCDEAQSREIVAAALDCGVTLFDTADLYGHGSSEGMLGAALKGRRQEAVIATKFGYPWTQGGGGSPAYARLALEASLRRLATDYVDILYLHAPDPLTPIADTLGALEDFRQAGLVREVGLSNVEAAHLDEALATADRGDAAPVAVVENQYNLLCRAPEEAVVPRCRSAGVGFIPYFPLASGLLTGKYRRGAPLPADSRLAWTLANRNITRPGDPTKRDDFERAVNWHPHERVRVDMDLIERLERFALERGRSMVDLALGWLARRPAVSCVIVGATSPAQVRANAAAVCCELSAEEEAALDRMTAEASIAGSTPLARS